MAARVILTDGMAELLASDGVRKHLHDLGERVAERARSTAPVVTGAYRDGITVTEGTTDRAVVRVGSTAPHASVVEARTGNLSRALDAAGGA